MFENGIIESSGYLEIKPSKKITQNNIHLKFYFLSLESYSGDILTDLSLKNYLWTDGDLEISASFDDLTMKNLTVICFGNVTIACKTLTLDNVQIFSKDTNFLFNNPAEHIITVSGNSGFFGIDDM